MNSSNTKQQQQQQQQQGHLKIPEGIKQETNKLKKLASSELGRIIHEKLLYLDLHEQWEALSVSDRQILASLYRQTTDRFHIQIEKLSNQTKTAFKEIIKKRCWINPQITSLTWDISDSSIIDSVDNIILGPIANVKQTATKIINQFVNSLWEAVAQSHNASSILEVILKSVQEGYSKYFAKVRFTNRTFISILEGKVYIDGEFVQGEPGSDEERSIYTNEILCTSEQLTNILRAVATYEVFNKLGIFQDKISDIKGDIVFCYKAKADNFNDWEVFRQIQEVFERLYKYFYTTENIVTRLAFTKNETLMFVQGLKLFINGKFVIYLNSEKEALYFNNLFNYTSK